MGKVIAKGAIPVRKTKFLDRNVSKNTKKQPTTNVKVYGGNKYPSALEMLWESENWNRVKKGNGPYFPATPTVTSDGVAPGNGPSFTDIVAWTDGGTLVVKFTADIASADIVGDVQVFGPVYAYSGGLEAKDGTNVASVSTSWASGDVVTAVVQVTDDGLMRVARGEGM